MKRQTNRQAQQFDDENPCKEFLTGITRTLDVVGSKWKVPLLCLLYKRSKRFNELRRELPNVTQHMLAASLRELESDGLVSRTVYAESPPRVEYSLTEEGRSLEGVFLALGEWGRSREFVANSSHL
ncbi:MAG TPA: helix-turn-helix domain-containing protein [Oculatellaceae cyanobacterium]